MKLKIINKTKYSGRDLRKFIIGAIKECGAEGVTTHVTIKHSHNDSHWGRAAINGHWVMMTLPKNPNKLEMRQFAQVAIHEIGHNLGLRHREMMSWRDINPKFHIGLILGHKDPQFGLPTPKKEQVKNTNMSLIQTVCHEIKKVHRSAKIELGVRFTPAGDRTINASLWDEDSDLFDTIPLLDVKEFPFNSEGLCELDAYLYDRSHDFMGNATVRVYNTGVVTVK